MKTIRLIRQNSKLLAYLQLDSNPPRRFLIDPKRPSQISLETAQLLFSRNARVDELNHQLIANAQILSSSPLLLPEYTSDCTLFGHRFSFPFPVSTSAGADDVIGSDILALFPGFRINDDDEASFDHDNPSGRYTHNELYIFRRFEGTNILQTMDHRFDELRRLDKTIRKPYHSNELILLMDMALDNAISYLDENQFAEAELILKKLTSMFYLKIDFDCNYSSPFHYSPTGKFLYLRAISSLHRNLHADAFSDLLKASAFFLPESPFHYLIQSTLRLILKNLASSPSHKLIL